MSDQLPAIDPRIEVRAGTDPADLSKRFEVFEALHHSMQICNPMTSAELDEVIDAVGLAGGEHLYDAACGYGEVLIRCAEKAAISGVGIDLSPWMVAGAIGASTTRTPDADLQWVLGEARDYAPNAQPDVAFCIGAEWVWHDFKGTTRAISQRLGPGGVAVIGAPRLHDRADPASVSRQFGAVETIDDMAETLADYALRPLHRVDPNDDAWDRYLDRTAVAAEQWREMHPGERADLWVAEQADWQAARERDREVIGWSLWVAQKVEATQ